MSMDRLWAGWRTDYVTTAAGQPEGCVFCGLLDSGLPDDESLIIWRGERVFAILNAYPYTSGHLLVMPVRHVADIDELESDEAAELWSAVTDAVRAVKSAYSPDGLNIGANLGRAAGAGVPGHFHIHALPRWNGDTNFLSTVAATRIMPESLPATWSKLTAAWPH